MSKCVDIDFILNETDEFAYENGALYGLSGNSAPSIDIVRCGECKKRKKNKFCLEYMRYEKNDEGFCSYGEREGDE